MNVLRVLLVGNGGRENAIAAALARSAREIELLNYATAVNPGLEELCEEIHLGGSLTDVDEIVAYAQAQKVTHAVVGPEAPLIAGVADGLAAVGVAVMGPTQALAQLEGSKAYTRNLLKEYKLDYSPVYRVFTDGGMVEAREAFYNRFDGQIVVKADGLCGGKGVLVAEEHFHSFAEADEFAVAAIEQFGRVVFEEKLVGVEFSLIAITDGTTLHTCLPVQDYKRAHDGDTGPNTGGMGAITDVDGTLPFLEPEHFEAARRILTHTLAAVQDDTGQTYRGVLFGGFMITHSGVKVIEFNCRFGDPECQNILTMLVSDFGEVLERTCDGTLGEMLMLEFSAEAVVTKYLCPDGYPDAPVKGEAVVVPEITPENVSVYYSSVGSEGGKLLLKGSRAIAVTATGPTLAEANEACESHLSHFSGPLFYRSDIGTAELLDRYAARLS